MDLYDMFAGAESFHVSKLLEHARALEPEQLDAPLGNQPRVFPWDSPAQSLRDLLRRLVQTKEIWTAARNGGTLPDLNAEPPEQVTPDLGTALPCPLLSEFCIQHSELRCVLITGARQQPDCD